MVLVLAWFFVSFCFFVVVYLFLEFWEYRSAFIFVYCISLEFWEYRSAFIFVYLFLELWEYRSAFTFVHLFLSFGNIGLLLFLYISS